MQFTNPFCKYKNIFGEPDTGIHHKYRVFDIAVVDAVFAIIFVGCISFLFNIPLQHALIYTILFMIISHRLFCVRTTTDKWLFP